MFDCAGSRVSDEPSNIKEGHLEVGRRRLEHAIEAARETGYPSLAAQLERILEDLLPGSDGEPA